METNRRGLMGLVVGAAGALRAPAVAAKEKAIEMAAAACTTAQALPIPDLSPKVMLLRELDRSRWAESPSYQIAPDRYPPSIACFRSASSAAKFAWYCAAQREENQRKEILRVAIELVQSGKFPI